MDCPKCKTKVVDASKWAYHHLDHDSESFTCSGCGKEWIVAYEEVERDLLLPCLEEPYASPLLQTAAELQAKVRATQLRYVAKVEKAYPVGKQLEYTTLDGRTHEGTVREVKVRFSQQEMTTDYSKNTVTVWGRPEVLVGFDEGPLQPIYFVVNCSV